MDKAIGTVYEISLRMLLLLEVAENAGMTADMLAAIDFITVYGRDFDVSEENLHGNGTYRFGEFTLRRELVWDALKPLVTQGLSMVRAYNRGFVYTLSKTGIEYCSNFESDYADNYRISAETAIKKYEGCPEREIIQMITRQTVQSLQRSL